MKDVMVDAIRSSVMQTADQISAAMPNSRRPTVADVLDESQLATFKTRYRARLRGFGIRAEVNLDAAMAAFDESTAMSAKVKDQWVEALRSVELDEMASAVEGVPVHPILFLDEFWTANSGTTVFDPLSWASSIGDV